MAPRFRCPHCQARMTLVNPDQSPRSIKCPRCGRAFSTAERAPSRLSRTAPPTDVPPQTNEDPLPTDVTPSAMPLWLLGGGGILAVIALVAVAWLTLRGHDEPRKGNSAGRQISQQGASQTPPTPVKAEGSRGVVPDRPVPEKKDGDPIAGDRGAVLVGVSDYDSSKLAPLKYPENDVEALARLLARPDTGFTSVRLLTTSRGKARPEDAPTAKNVRDAVKALLRGRKRDDVVLIGLSGHGVSLEDQ